MSAAVPGPLLAKVTYPSDLRKLRKDQLPQFCQELRQFIVDTVAVHGGHFGASMGVVELTVAIHYVYDTPNDQLVWDVGHQAYGHKIITGRRDVFHTNRKYKGISGFPKRDESEYDTFGVGHSSTSISAALGMAEASHYLKVNKQHIAVIGDGSMTAGMAFEAMNHAGVSNSNMLIILNDNGISIDPNVGALKEYLTDVTTSSTYNKFRTDVWDALSHLPGGKTSQQILSKVEASLKGIISKSSNIFEALKLRYFGPIDGHNVIRLVEVLSELKNIGGPKLLHIVTTKGKGYDLAEKDQTLWHAPGLFNPETGELIKKVSDKPTPPKYQDVFGQTIIELAKQNDKIMGITPAMPSGSSLKYMMKEMPDRAFDVGIAEQHAVTFSAGLATQGMRPFCNIYSSFMQRAYDQVIHDVALQNLGVIFCLDRGGVVGDDGATHHGAYDMAYFRCIPNMVVSAPMNEEELRNLMYTAQLDKNNRPISIRYPRGEGVMVDWKKPFAEIEIGTGRKIAEGEKVAVLSIGHTGNAVVEAMAKLGTEGIHPAHYDMRFVKPLDAQLLQEVFTKFDKVITIEDGCIMGGMGSAVLEWMSDHGFKASVKRLGIPDQYIEHGSQQQLYTDCGYNVADIEKAVKDFWN
ncbi:MAG: 1-deoxy-D-xylulose-5-phosphate synthase [Chitinophagales bacterium]|jgi:1-deoxy-D-xylulose-5-phosphate synthase|nr:1-deoxy-D-xylulose-5-phosphate synthase [Chitinophagales bacterium]